MVESIRVLLKGWHVGPVVVVLLVLAAAAALLPTVLELPQVGAIGAIASPVGTIAGLGVALCGLTLAGEPSRQLVLTAPASRRLVNPVRVLGGAAGGVLLLAAVAHAPLLATWIATSALLGEGLVMGALVGLRFGWLIPTAHVLAAMTFGAANRIDLAVWAWILRSDPSSEGQFLSGSILLIGLVVWSWALGREPRRSWRGG